MNPTQYPTIYGLGLTAPTFDFNAETTLWQWIAKAVGDETHYDYQIERIEGAAGGEWGEDNIDDFRLSNTMRDDANYDGSDSDDDDSDSDSDSDSGASLLPPSDAARYRAAIAFLAELEKTKAPKYALIWLSNHMDDESAYEVEQWTVGLDQYEDADGEPLTDDDSIQGQLRLIREDALR